MNFYDEKIEKSILGILLSFKEYQDEILLNIQPRYFYFDVNKAIFIAAKKMDIEGKDIDMFTVVSYMQNSKQLASAGGAYYISTLTSEIASGTNYMTYVRILKEFFLKRQLYLLFNSGLKSLKSDKDIFDIFNKFNGEIEDLFTLKDNDLYNMYDVIQERLKEISNINTDYNNIIGIKTGFDPLNEMTSGWQNGDLILLAGRPSMGKTAVSLFTAKYASIIEQKNILFFSLEMNKNRIADRLISLETGINSQKLQSNSLNVNDWTLIDNTVPVFKNTNFQINDDSDLTVEDIRNIAIIENKKKKIDLIVIDYLQIINYSVEGTTNEKVMHISKNLKSLAKKINCPVVALSQLKRTQSVKPDLSDLRDSGALEQDADIVIFVHRYDYQGAECDINQKNLIELIIAKNRNGAIGAAEIYRADDWSKFYSNNNNIFDIPFTDESAQLY